MILDVFLIWGALCADWLQSTGTVILYEHRVESKSTVEQQVYYVLSVYSILRLGKMASYSCWRHRHHPGHPLFQAQTR